MSDEILIRKGIVIGLGSSQTSLATWEWNTDSETLTCSKPLFKLLNLAPNKRFLSVEEQTALFSYHDLKKLVRVLQQSFSEKTPFEIEVGINTKDHETRRCVLYGYPTINDSQKIISINGTLKDVSKIKEEQAIIKEVQQYQQQIIEASNEGIFLLDANTHHILDANKTSESICEFNKEELKQFSFEHLCAQRSDLSPEKLKALLRKAIIADEHQVFECLIETKSSKEVWLEIFAKYVDINNLPRIILSARDISKRKNSELKSASEELRQKFLINISLFNAQSLNELLDYILGEVLKNSNSILGYISFHNITNSIILIKNLKDRFETLNTLETNTLSLVEDKNFWSDIVLLRRPIIDNNFDITHHLKGVYEPEGIQKLKYLSIPIFKENKIVASIGITNTKRDYTQKDVEELTFFMDTVWDIVEAKKFSKKNLTNTDIYLSAIKQSPLVIEQYDKNGLQLAANEAYEKLWGFPASTTVNSFNILKSIEIKNSILYEYVQRAYAGESVLTPDYRFNSSFNSKENYWFSTRIYPTLNAAREVEGITITHDNITAKKEQTLAEEARHKNMRLQSELLSQIINDLPLRIFWKNDSGTYIGCNKLFAEDAGFNSPSEIIGKTDAALQWEREVLKIRSRDFENVISSADYIKKELSYKNNAGAEVWLKTSLLPLKNSTNTTSGVLGIYDDISLEKKAEVTLLKRIEESQEEHFSLSKLINLSNLEDIYTYVSESLHAEFPDSIIAFTSVNQSETKLTIKNIQGINDNTKAQIQSITNFNIQGRNLNVYPSNYEIYKKSKLVEFAGGLDLYFGIQFPSMEARKIEHLLSISNIYTIGINQDDKLLGVAHIFATKSINPDKKRALETIAKQSAFVMERRSLIPGEILTLDHIYKTIETSSDAILITEALSGTIAAGNARSEHMFNRDLEDLVGFHYSTIFPDDKRKTYEQTFGSAIKTNEPTNGEFWVEAKDGNQIPVIISTSFINSNNKIYVMLIFHDIVKRKQAEALVEQKNTELQQLITTKDKLFSIISHDLKNPLTGIVGFAEVVKDELPEDGDGQLIKFMDIIIRSADSMVYLINNLLHWSRIQQGAIKPKFNKIKIYEITEREFELLFTAANNKNIDLINATDFDTLAFGDGEMISTVIRNLVSNAIKFTPNDGSVTVSSKLVDEMVEISITDTGVGMQKEVADKLFRINNEVQRNGTAGEKGTGLGLVICKDFVEQNNGTIWVESTIDKGTTFYFNVPLYKE